MIDLNKTYQTREGYKVKLAGINKDADILHQLIGWVYYPLGISEHSWDLNGISSYGNLDSLVEIPQPKVGDLWKVDGKTIFIYKKLTDGRFCFIDSTYHASEKSKGDYFANGILLYRDEDYNQYKGWAV
jgi:hypothetical protein